MARHRKMSTYMPRGRPTTAYRYITAVAGIKSAIKKQVKKEVKSELHAGRPMSMTKSLRVLGGKLRVKEAKSRVIRVGNKSLVV